MHTPVKFKRMQELAAELSDRLDQLESGLLSKSQLEDLTEHSRELYERLVVLRFKAYNQEVKPEVEANERPIDKPNEDSVSEPKEAPLSIPAFRIELSAADPTPAASPVAELEEEKEPVQDTRQVSLIDAIEEVSKEAEETTVSIQETIAQAQKNAGPSLHDKLTQQFAGTESIGQRMEHTPISDLKKAITLNQRFQFSRELFKGNNQDYEMAIDKLNTVDREEAMNHLESLRNRYTWNNEDMVTNDFVELVTRRHQ
jgi:hypothetical protein